MRKRTSIRWDMVGLKGHRTTASVEHLLCCRSFGVQFLSHSGDPRSKPHTITTHKSIINIMASELLAKRINISLDASITNCIVKNYRKNITCTMYVCVRSVDNGWATHASATQAHFHGREFVASHRRTRARIAFGCTFLFSIYACWIFYERPNVLYFKL